MNKKKSYVQSRTGTATLFRTVLYVNYFAVNWAYHGNMIN